MQPHRQSLSCQRCERLCALSSSSSLIYHFWFLKYHHSAATPHLHQRYWRSCRTHENYMHAEQIIIIFYIFYFIFCSMCLVLFSIVLYRTIVTVYTDNIFLYNYLWQMHQIIHLSPLGCFTPARGKTVQKNGEVSGVKSGVHGAFICLILLPKEIIYLSTDYVMHWICLTQEKCKLCIAMWQSDVFDFAT